MKNGIVASLAFLFLATSGAFASSREVLLFEETFESGDLHQWTGDVYGAHHGQIVADPLRSGNHVVTFTAVDANGDIFSEGPIPVGNSNEEYVVSFDYLGLAQERAGERNFGGFLGIATSVDLWQQGRYWLAGTDTNGINTDIGIQLTDDGAWHHYEIDITRLLQEAGITTMHLMVEDWNEVGDSPGDAYFDNIQLTGRERGRPTLQLYVTEVTLCWESKLNHNYQVQYRSPRTPGGWTDLGAPVTGNGGTNCVADHLDLGEPQRFYRVVDTR